MYIDTIKTTPFDLRNAVGNFCELEILIEDNTFG